MACPSVSTPTFGANPLTGCGMAAHCVAADGRSWYYPEHMDFMAVTGGSCPQAQNSGVFSATATRCDLLDHADPDWCAGAKTCADVVADGCDPAWTTGLCGINYVWRPDLTGYTIPDCGPFVSNANFQCSAAPTGFLGVFDCDHLDTKHPRKSWFNGGFVVSRAFTAIVAHSCPCGAIDESGVQTCDWYYYDSDCNFQFGGTYTVTGGIGTPPCPAGTVASGCVCCRPTTCGECVAQCAPDRCKNLVECCDAGDPSSCWTYQNPPDGCTCDGTSSFLCNKAGCFGDCGVCLQQRNYNPLAFCNGCVTSQDDIQGCNPYNCPPDPKNYGNLVVRLRACPTIDAGIYEACVPMALNDYIDWHCPATPEEMAMHRAFVLVANGATLGDALAVTGAKDARAFRPCRHHPHQADCVFCHSVAYQPGYAEAIDRRLAGETTVRIGFGQNTPPTVAAGPGTEYKKLTDQLGLKEWDGCGCAAIRQQMDRAGVAGCQKRRAEFVAKIKANIAAGVAGKKIGPRDWTRAVLNAIRTGLVLNPFRPMDSLYDLAVRNAEAELPASAGAGAAR